MNDLISLTGLRVFGRHGVLPQERRDGQDFVVDVLLSVDTRAAAASDDIANTVDYAVLADKVAVIVAGEPMNLIETLATRIAEMCLEDFGVIAATVIVRKPGAPIPHAFADVAVTVVRP